ncbi:hypothetical protein [Alkalihalobacillus sp. TS-13]|uniref:hypothetical protein n=1 Tax=Alkalihalobacillus sp. TS-13 TaxID=2842455 RepID=UPI001C88CF94|nr:hypothetical protein [Alkalihalobacillus sp. TS-13]
MDFKIKGVYLLNHITSEDIKIFCSEDCGNSPKKEMLKKFNIAIAINDRNYFMENLSDDIYWKKAGAQMIEGKEQFAEMLIQNVDGDITELHIYNIITHGRSASVNGELVYKNKQRTAFCHVYNFTGAGKTSKIKEITSYVIDMD